MGDSPTPIEVAATLSAIVDVLIPGDDIFPAASTAGTHGLVFNRVRQQLGNQAFSKLTEGVNKNGDFAKLLPDERIGVLLAFQADDPELFVFLRSATYFSYYETPPVIATLQALGHDYNDAPQPLGYEMPPFDPAAHVPVIPRGSYKKTGEITRIDLSALADLDLPIEEHPSGP